MNRRNLRKAQGVTLIELLVSLAVGLLVTVAAGSLYLVARQGFRVSDDQSRNFETGRLAVEILTRNIRMAGAPQFNPATPNAVVRFPPAANPLAVPVQGTEGGAQPDRLVVSYVSDQPYNAATLTGADCLGQNVGANLVVKTFSISADGQLQCQGNGGAGAAPAAPIAAQVVDMQVVYGVAAGPDEGAVSSYVTADLVTNWRTVRSVDICLEVVSFDANTISGRTPGVNCRGAAFPSDNRVHRLFRTSVNLRNGTTGNIFPGNAIP
ncbi:MAG TPA: PilW family protein [Burkholderiaceae bacterium]|nr:PilW family protein [Burkholderiaceae bacterium]